MSASAIQNKLMEKAVEEAVKTTEGTAAGQKPSGPGSFDAILQSADLVVDEGEALLETLGMGAPSSTLTGSMESVSAAGVVPAGDSPLLVKEGDGRKLVDLLSEVNKGQMQMDHVINQILYSGKRFSNQELLAIQAHVFHVAQLTELTVKVADQGVSSVKSVLNTQIQ